MTTLTAIEALRELSAHLRSGDWNLRAPQEMADMSASMIDNLAAALAVEPQQPVAAYQYQFEGLYGPVWRNDPGTWNGLRPVATRPLYAAPQAAATPPQAEREALTDAEIAEAMIEVDDPLLWGRLGEGSGDMLRQFARAIERAARAADRAHPDTAQGGAAK